jgi:hypothetical protein
MAATPRQSTVPSHWLLIQAARCMPARLGLFRVFRVFGGITLAMFGLLVGAATARAQVGGASYADSSDFVLNTTGLSPIAGGATYADSGEFTLNTTGLSSIAGGASYADSADFAVNTTGLSAVIGGASYADSADFTLTTEPPDLGNPLWVDFNYVGATQNGTYDFPFKTVAQGTAAVTAGGDIWIKTAGSSPETITITKPMTIRAYAGPATIGH